MTVLTRVKDILIGYNASHYATLSGVKSVGWNDSDPFVLLPVSGSGTANITVYQEIKPIVWVVKIDCLDATSLNTVLYATFVDLAGTKYAVDPTTQKRTAIAYFKIETRDQAGTAVVYSVTNARVKDIAVGEITEGEKEATLIVTFYADLVKKD